MTDDGGSVTRGSSDVHDRARKHRIKRTTPQLKSSHRSHDSGTRQHSPFQFTKELDSASPYLLKAAATGQTLKSAEFRFYHINDAGQEVEYYRITLENIKVISVSPAMYDTRSCSGTGHREEVAPDYEKIIHLCKEGNLLAHDAWNERPTA